MGMDIETALRIEALEGRLLATQAALRALIACHPEPERAIDIVANNLDRFAGIALAQAQPDAMVDALAKAEHYLLPSEEELAAARDRR